MKRQRSSRRGLALLCGGLAGMAPAAHACATCFGASDSPLAAGMNMGILTLLVIILGMWAAVGGFFIYVARRGARAAVAAKAE